jgi:hypothetical protein
VSAAWTDEEIRAATAFPKPRGALDRWWAHDTDQLRQQADEKTLEERLLACVVEHGGYIQSASSEECPSGVWVLAPLDWSLVEMLEQFEGERSDLEPGEDLEPDAGDEPSLGSTATMSQLAAWQDPRPWEVDRELDAIDDELSGDDEPDHDSDQDCDNEPNGADLIWAPDWPPKGLPVFATSDEQSIKGGDHG